MEVSNCHLWLRDMLYKIIILVPTQDCLKITIEGCMEANTKSKPRKPRCTHLGNCCPQLHYVGFQQAKGKPDFAKPTSASTSRQAPSPPCGPLAWGGQMRSRIYGRNPRFQRPCRPPQFTITPWRRDPLTKQLHHGELVLLPGELAIHWQVDALSSAIRLGQP